jgi:hypothetical protein
MRAAAEVLDRLGRPGPEQQLADMAPYRHTQALLGRIFALDRPHELKDMPDETILCRCENRSIGDLRACGPHESSARMLRLNGRFGMGACQGGSASIGWQS